MNQLLKYLVYAVGGASILTVSFFSFAVLSGTSMSEIGGIGRMFPEPEPGATVTRQDRPDIEDELASDQRGTARTLDESTSPLKAFLMPAGFSAGELEALEKALKARMAALERRQRALDEREQELVETARHYEELYARLEELRNGILDEEAEVSALKEEAERDRRAVLEREAESFRQMSGIFEQGKASDAARLLVEVYPAEEAAKILAALDDERAAALLAAVHAIAPERSRDYHRAYRLER